MNRFTQMLALSLLAMLLSGVGGSLSAIGPPLEAGDDFVDAGGSSTFFDPLANDAVFGLRTLDPFSFEILDTPTLGTISPWSVSELGVEVLYLRDPSAPWEADAVRYRICTTGGDCDEAVMWLLTGSIGPLVSGEPTRTNPVELSYASLSGNAYIFLPDLFTTGTIRSVRFLLDGEPAAFEREAPWDLAGGTISRANPLDTTRLENGIAVVTTEIQFATSAGGHIDRFDTPTTVANLSLLAFSYSADRSSAGRLDGSFFGGDVYVFLGVVPLSPGVGPVPVGGAGIRRVSFLLDGSTIRVENQAPYDLGGGSVITAWPFDMSALAVGHHELVAIIDYTDGRRESVSAGFETLG